MRKAVAAWKYFVAWLALTWRHRVQVESQVVDEVLPEALLELPPTPPPQLVVDVVPEITLTETHPLPATHLVEHEAEAETLDVTRWHLRGAILDRLDEYFVCLDRLRHHDPDAYGTFSRLGFAVSADRFVNPDYAANREALRTCKRPTFGGVMIPQLEDDTKVLPSFVYFRKLRRPRALQAVRGDVYEVTVIFDHRAGPGEKWRSKLVVPMTCHIGVTHDGEAGLLKQDVSTHSEIHPKRGESFTLRMREWRYPEWVLDAAEEHEADPSVWASGLLVLVLGTYLASTDRIVIRAQKDGAVAAFGIELPRAVYFFRDRDNTALARDGKRKRIFHSVVSHQRRIGEERATQVKSHFRGVRAFDWNGYQIHIVLPAVSDVLRFDKPGMMPEDVLPHEVDLIDEHDIAKKLQEVLVQ